MPPRALGFLLVLVLVLGLALSPAADLGSGGGLPGVARTEAWGRRLLNTQLASWAQLRHDTILYAKQVYAEMGAGPLPPPTPPGRHTAAVNSTHRHPKGSLHLFLPLARAPTVTWFSVLENTSPCERSDRWEAARTRSLW